MRSSRWFVYLFLAFILVGPVVEAQTITIPRLSLDFEQSDKPKEIVSAIKIVIAMTLLALAPSLLLAMTSFTRLVIVLSLLRQAIGVHQAPPNQVVVGLAIFLTFFIMQPYLNEINEKALQPYLAEKISQDQALDGAVKPLRTFMLKQTRKKDLAMFLSLSKAPRPQTPDDISLVSLVPAFIISELKSAFQMGFMIYIPFLVIDMVVATILMAMGMMVLPPILISLPFKLMLFVMVDGWSLMMHSVMKSFN
ncbi:MAG: flagellar biosynthetic protein FliP [Deltaproteobacteria bacterium RIFOXYA12_FULL_61_11]|nr:MAG: flagellar biosynthetic protein FliP [Deltaproteobacteria bacterium RIFOXYA12_FULL_61_11]